MYLIILALLPILNSQTTKLISNINNTKNYHLHLNEEKAFLKFPNVIDAQLYTNHSDPFCKLSQKNIAIYQKQLQILENHQIYEQVDDQFICMTQIQNGIIVLTTDFILYQFELNYNAIQSNNTNLFAKKIWTADFKPIIQNFSQISEFAQIIFCAPLNSTLIVFPSSAYLINLQQTKTEESNLQIISVGDWISRPSRGLTKSINDLIFTCVGENGIDIYRSTSNSLRLLGNLNYSSLQLEQFNLKDFTLINLKDFIYKCFFLDVNGNVYVIEIKIINYDFTFQLLTQIKPKGQGISIDTKNGLNVFVAYSITHLYYVIEYYISLNQSICFELNSYITRNEIKSIDATDDFAILQGNNHHKIIFRSDIFQLNSNIIPVFSYIGLRDFEMFSSFSEINSIMKSFDFFIGITSTSLLLAKFYIQPFQIMCNPEQREIQETQFYQLITNTSQILETNNEIDQIITQTIFNFTIELLETDDSEYQIEDFQIVIAIILFLLLSAFFYQIHKYKRQIQNLEKQISMGQRRNSIKAYQI
ncbi:unnamed protein product [Paramecium sonneborni]|uniref:Transmembrane protein n=1 Tax=Paramecium sonneborni TaxID=65129 RepID=A0A8S1M1W8_9CILI|nr:unnamed protein product [Paramecium sonneborni]